MSPAKRHISKCVFLLKKKYIYNIIRTQCKLGANFVTSIKSINQNSNNHGNFDVRGASKLLKEKVEVDSYGSHKSQSEAILYDNENQMPVTVWENVLAEFEEETLYLFQFISLKNYYGSKLTATKFTIVSVKEESLTYFHKKPSITTLNLTKNCTVNYSQSYFAPKSLQ